MRSETIAVHAGGEPDPATGGIAPPIYEIRDLADLEGIVDPS